MSKLEELIKKLCPDGVEYKKVESITDRFKGSPITAAEMKNMIVDNGPIRIFAGGKTQIDTDYSHVKNFTIIDTPSVVVKSRGIVDVEYYDKPFTFKQEMWAYVGKDKEMLTKFLYYVLQTKLPLLRVKGSKMGSMPQIKLEDTDGLSLPVPPLEVQREIVRVLDKFTALTAELTAELTARKQQYEYYRDALLTFTKENGGARPSSVTLSEVAKYSSERIACKDITGANYVGVDNLLQNKKGKTLSNYVPSNGNLTKYNKEDILIGNIRPYLQKIWFADCAGGTSGDVLAIHVVERTLLPKYLYYILSSDNFFYYDTQHTRGGKMPRGNKEAVMKYELSVPPLSEQKRIVDILDRFDKLCNDISEGLPAEIEARKKQYEYYRDSLLTFKKLA